MAVLGTVGIVKVLGLSEHDVEEIFVGDDTGWGDCIIGGVLVG